jgi:hypothetical protein
VRLGRFARLGQADVELNSLSIAQPRGPRFAHDSLLEGRGFEPLVPLTTETHFRAPIDAPSCAHGVKKDLLQPKGRPMVRIPFPPLASSTLVLREIELKAAVRAS